MLSRTLIVIGLLFIAAGVIVSIAPRIPFLGRLPGDIFIRRDHVSFYFPITTSIIISIVLTLLFYLFGRR